MVHSRGILPFADHLRPRPICSALRLALALALVGPASTGPLLSATPQAKASAPTEKELLAAFRDAYDSKDPAARAAALGTLGAESRKLPDKGASKKVAQALVLGLEDEELEVGAAALFQLGQEREVDTVIGALGACLQAHFEELEHRLGKSDVRSSDYVRRASVLFGNGCRVLSNYKDDRSATLLVGLLAALPEESEENDLATGLMGALAPSALELGTLAAFETAVKRIEDFDPKVEDGAARKLHDALAAASKKAGTTPPEWNEATPAAWQAWLEEHKALFPQKLGRLTAPPKSEPAFPLHGLPGKSAGG